MDWVHLFRLRARVLALMLTGRYTALEKNACIRWYARMPSLCQHLAGRGESP